MEAVKKTERKPLDIEKLKKISGGSNYESWEIVEVIDRNPNLKTMWLNALDTAYDINPHDELAYFHAAEDVLNRIGVEAMFIDSDNPADTNMYRNSNGNLTQQQVVDYVRNYK